MGLFMNSELEVPTLSEGVAVRALLCVLAARCGELRNDERGEMEMERIMLTTIMISLAIVVVAIGVPKLIHLFAGS